MITACLIDTLILRLSPFTGDLPSSSKIWVICALTICWAIGQLVVLQFIDTKIKASKIKPIDLINKIVLIIQWLTISILVIIILQMLLTSNYSLLLLKIIVLMNCGMSVGMLGFLSKQFFVWFILYHDKILITYAIATLFLTLNILSMVFFIYDSLNDFEENIRYNTNPVLSITNLDTVYNQIYGTSSTISFIMMWIATVFLLRYYSKKIGTVRYWIIVSAPLFYFLSQFQPVFLGLFFEFRISDPMLFGIIFTIVFTLNKPLGGFLFGAAFWSVSKKVGQHRIKDYLVISGFGIVILFTSNQITSLIFAPYPPFGLITTSLIGLSSYMLLVGIYSSALSISKDTELRRYIHNVVDREIKILGSLGFAQLERELVTRVVPLAQIQAQKMEQETGIQTSLSGEDLKQYLEEILSEIKNPK